MQNFGKPVLHTSPPQGEWLVLVRSTINSMIIQNLIELYHESGFELYVHNLYGERPDKETENIRCVIYFRKIASS